MRTSATRGKRNSGSPNAFIDRDFLRHGNGFALKLKGLSVDALREEGANIVCVLAIVDRLEGAKENFAAEGLEFRALYTADEFLNP